MIRMYIMEVISALPLSGRAFFVVECPRKDDISFDKEDDNDDGRAGNRVGS